MGPPQRQSVAQISQEFGIHVATLYNWRHNWIVEVITDTLTRKGKRNVRRHLFLTSIRTTPEALLRLVRQRWSIENEWHWARDAQLGEDAHRYANRIGAPVFAFLRTIVMNLLRRAATARSARDCGSWPTTSRECWRWEGWRRLTPLLDHTFRQPWGGEL
jgi:predicted transposase YbfD/YdcC